MNRTNARPALWSKAFILIIVAFFFTGMGMTIMNNTISLYVESLGKGMTYSGILAALFMVSAVISRFVTGYFSDRVPRKNLIIAGAIVFGTATLGMAFFPIYAVVALLRFLQGFGYSMVQTSISAAGSDVLPDARMGEGVGYLGLGNSLTNVLGPIVALSLIIDNGKNFVLVYIVNSVLIFLTIVLILVSRYETNSYYIERKSRLGDKASVAHQLSRYQGVWKFLDKRAVTTCILTFLLCISSATAVTFLTVYTKHTGVGSPSAFYACSTVVMILGRLVTGNLVDKHNPLVVLIPALLMHGLGYLILSTIPSTPLFLLSGALYGLSFGAVMPALNSIAVKKCGELRFGAANATYYLGADLGTGLGGLLCGTLIDSQGFPFVYRCAAGVIVLTTVLSVVFYRKGVIPAAVEER